MWLTCGQNQKMRFFKQNKNLRNRFVTEILMVGVAGLEPAASCSRSKHATKLRYTPSSECTMAKLRYTTLNLPILTHYTI